MTPFPDLPPEAIRSIDFDAMPGEDFELKILPRPGERVVRLETEASRELEDLNGIRFDLRRVAMLCKAYVARMVPGVDVLDEDALWMTAVMLYARCFATGVRKPLETVYLDEIPGQARDTHNHFLDLRNKFVAHSVNSYEQTVAYAVVSAETGELKSTGTAHLWANPVNREGADMLERLAWAGYNAAEVRRLEVATTVDEEARALGAEGLGRLRDLQVETPNVARGKKQRKR